VVGAQQALAVGQGLLMQGEGLIKTARVLSATVLRNCAPVIRW
jgi:hypothetical protein